MSEDLWLGIAREINCRMQVIDHRTLLLRDDLLWPTKGSPKAMSADNDLRDAIEEMLYDECFLEGSGATAGEVADAVILLLKRWEAKEPE